MQGTANSEAETSVESPKERDMMEHETRQDEGRTETERPGRTRKTLYFYFYFILAVERKRGGRDVMGFGSRGEMRVEDGRWGSCLLLWFKPSDERRTVRSYNH
jgi:hypothetical protein